MCGLSVKWPNIWVCNMYWKYLRSLLIHKWRVFIICCKLGVPLLGLIHDISKFAPKRFVLYAKYRYGGEEMSRRVKQDYMCEMARHYLSDKHHWQYWVILNERGIGALGMPERYVAEMVADWVARNGNNANYALMWYRSYHDNIILSASSAMLAEDLLTNLAYTSLV